MEHKSHIAGVIPETIFQLINFDIILCLFNYSLAQSHDQLLLLVDLQRKQPIYGMKKDHLAHWHILSNT